MPPVTLPDYTIEDGETDGPVIDLRDATYQFAEGLLIVAPTVLSETVKVHAAAKKTGTFQPLQSNGQDIVLTAGKSQVIQPTRVIAAIMLIADVGVSGDKVFQMSTAKG